MAEVLDDSKEFTIGVIAPIPSKLEIISLGGDFVPGVTKKEGDQVKGTVTVKNIGGEVAEVCNRLIDVETDKFIDTNPMWIPFTDGKCSFYDNIAPGESKTYELGSKDMRGVAMPNKPWKLRVEAWRQT